MVPEPPCVRPEQKRGAAGPRCGWYCWSMTDDVDGTADDDVDGTTDDVDGAAGP